MWLIPIFCFTECVRFLSDFSIFHMGSMCFLQEGMYLWKQGLCTLFTWWWALSLAWVISSCIAWDALCSTNWVKACILPWSNHWFRICILTSWFVACFPPTWQLWGWTGTLPQLSGLVCGSPLLFWVKAKSLLFPAKAVVNLQVDSRMGDWKTLPYSVFCSEWLFCKWQYSQSGDLPMT